MLQGFTSKMNARSSIKRCYIIKSYLQIGFRNTDSQDIMADGSSKWLLSRLSQVSYQSSRLQSKSIYSLYLCLRLSNRNVLRIIFRFVSRCVSCGNTRSVQMISKVSRVDNIGAHQIYINLGFQKLDRSEFGIRFRVKIHD